MLLKCWPFSNKLVTKNEVFESCFSCILGKNQCQRVIKAGDFDVGKQKVNDIYLHRGSDKFCNTFYGSANLAKLSFSYKLDISCQETTLSAGWPFQKKNFLGVVICCNREIIFCPWIVRTTKNNQRRRVSYSKPQGGQYI